MLSSILKNVSFLITNIHNLTNHSTTAFPLLLIISNLRSSNPVARPYIVTSCVTSFPLVSTQSFYLSLSILRFPEVDNAAFLSSARASSPLKYSYISDISKWSCLPFFLSVFQPPSSFLLSYLIDLLSE